MKLSYSHVHHDQHIHVKYHVLLIKSKIIDYSRSRIILSFAHISVICNRPVFQPTRLIVLSPEIEEIQSDERTELKESTITFMK